MLTNIELTKVNPVNLGILTTCVCLLLVLIFVFEETFSND